MKTKLLPIGQPPVRLGHFAKLFAVAALLAGVVAPAAHASDPHGIYAFVDRVVFEPSDASPERIQVWGGFALAKGRGDTYTDAVRGCLYFKLRAGEEDLCKKEWADLKAVAGTSQLVSFGSRHELPLPTVRSTSVKMENADVYPKGWGMSKVQDRDYAPILQLRKLQGKKTDAKEPSKSPAK